MLLMSAILAWLVLLPELQNQTYSLTLTPDQWLNGMLDLQATVKDDLNFTSQLHLRVLLGNAPGETGSLMGAAGHNLFIFGEADESAVSANTGASYVYRFVRGVGSNTMDERGGQDVIELGEGIAKQDVTHC